MADAVPDLRGHALDALAAAIAAVQPARLIRQAVTVAHDQVVVCGSPLPAATGRHLLVALGKAGPGLAEAWLEHLPGWADEVFVLAPHRVAASPALTTRTTVWRGAHPLPDGDGEASTQRLLALAGALGPDDLLVLLLSGGASALLAAPRPGLTLDDVATTTRELLRAGAPIGALNAVRRQLLTAAGGGLARAASPARVVTLVLSDVLGDHLPDIASGPTVPSPTTAADALRVIEDHALRQRLPAAVLRLLERPPPEPTAARPDWAGRSTCLVLANNRTAATAAATNLALRGVAVSAVEAPVTGEAAARGRQLGALAAALRPSRPAALVVGSETTVTVRGSGRGGRCQELALAAALELEDSTPCLVLAAGSDGIDGASDNAGAAVDPTTCRRLRAVGIDPRAALADNDSATALAACGDAIVTGPTGSNVCDLVIVLARPP